MCVVCGVVAGVVCGFGFVWYSPSLCLGFGWYGCPFVWRWCSAEGLVAFDLVWGWPSLYLGWCGMWFWFCLVQALLVSRLVWYDVRVVWLCFTS